MSGLTRKDNDNQARARSGVERRQRFLGPPGEERRMSDTDRRIENNREFISFSVAGQTLGISVDKVQEILPPQTLTKVPLAQPCVAGLLNLRGQIVTAVDLRRRLSLPEREKPSEFMNIIVSDHNELYSLMVDNVADVMAVAQSNFTQAPATLDDHWKQVCEGVYRLRHGLLIVVDVPSLLKLTEIN